MSKIRALLTKINDAIRPPHVGPLPSTEISALGGNLSTQQSAELQGVDGAKAAAQIGQAGSV